MIVFLFLKLISFILIDGFCLFKVSKLIILVREFRIFGWLGVFGFRKVFIFVDLGWFLLLKVGFIVIFASELVIGWILLSLRCYLLKQYFLAVELLLIP
jgi:hypothetical protein